MWVDKEIGKIKVNVRIGLGKDANMRAWAKVWAKEQLMYLFTWMLEFLLL